MPQLTIVSGAQQGTVFYLKPGVNRVGRHPTNDLQIVDASVSSHHCEVTRSETGILVRDLNSTNGICVDGKPVTDESGPQSLNRVLLIGRIELHLQTDLEGADAPVIRIPELPVAETIRSGSLPDGSPACLNHIDTAATFRCPRCEHTFCESCVRMVRRRGGSATLVFCTNCSAACEPLAIAPSKRRKRKLLGWLTSTLKLPFRR